MILLGACNALEDCVCGHCMAPKQDCSLGKPPMATAPATGRSSPCDSDHMLLLSAKGEPLEVSELVPWCLGFGRFAWVKLPGVLGILKLTHGR